MSGKHKCFEISLANAAKLQSAVDLGITVYKLINTSEQFCTFNFGHDTEYKGHTAEWLVEALCYKPEGRGFDSQRGHCISQLT
jgi:hypothetical protein